MLISAADHAELVRLVRLDEADTRAWRVPESELVTLLRRIIEPPGAITVTLPMPVSANRYWAHRSLDSKGAGKARAITYVTEDARAYRKTVAWLMMKAGMRKPFPGRVAMHLKVYPHRPLDHEKRKRKDPLYWADTVRRMDLGNHRKTLEDALNGIAYRDDKCIWMDGGEIMEPDGRETCVVLTLWPLVPR